MVAQRSPPNGFVGREAIGISRRWLGRARDRRAERVRACQAVCWASRAAEPLRGNREISRPTIGPRIAGPHREGRRAEARCCTGGRSRTLGERDRATGGGADAAKGRGQGESGPGWHAPGRACPPGWTAYGKRQEKSQRTGSRCSTIVDLLRWAYFQLKREAAAGVDGLTWRDYGESLEAKLADLHARVHRGSYRAQPSRRRYTPKPDGRQRPLGIAAPEDKIVQRPTAELLNAIYEEDFLGFSYGFRAGRSQHDALNALTAIEGTTVNWILDADIARFLRRGGPRALDSLRAAPHRRPAGRPPDPRVAEGPGDGGLGGAAGRGRHAARRGDLAAPGQYLFPLRLRSLGPAVAATPRPT
jgi:hypothetical protein